MKMSARIGLVMASIMLIMSVSAIETTSRTPIITANSSSENITLNNITLTRSVGEVPLRYNGSSGLTTLAAITPTTLFDLLRAIPDNVALENREFLFRINISDDSTLKNSAAYTFWFNVSAPGQIISLVTPQFGGFNTSDTNVVIQSELPSVCRWGATSNPITFELAFRTMTPMTPDGTARRHTIENLFSLLMIEPTEGAEATISVTCNESNILTPSVWTITHLTTPPEPTIALSTQIIVDPVSPQTVITVLANQDVWCELTNTGISTSGPRIFGEETYDAYAPAISGILAVPYPASNFNITVFCKNRAGLSIEKNVSIAVNFEQPIVINMLSPTNTNIRSYRFNFSTSAAAWCTATRDGAGIVLSRNAAANNPASMFWRDESFTTDGTYRYNVSCATIAYTGTTTAQLSVSVDSKPPTFTSIDARPLSCDLNSMSFTFNATATPPSGIGSYSYTIRNRATDAVVAQGTQTTPFVNRGNLNLANNTEYIISGTVQDTAGNSAGPRATTFRATTNKDLACDTEDPRTAIAVNRTGTKAVIRFLCSDNNACKNEYRWQRVNVTQTCNVTQSMTAVTPLNKTQEITARSKICWLVSDVNDRFVRGEQVIDITLPPSGNTSGNNTTTISPVVLCSNNKLDTTNFETDIDCGGFICAAEANKMCANGKKCVANSDCSGRWCDFGSCKSASCTDGVKNGLEQAVDCGGACGACNSTTTTTCTKQADCSSGKTCTRGVCVNPGELKEPEPEDEEPAAQEENSGVMSLVFIILGSLLVLAGMGTIVVYEEPKKKPVVEQDEGPIATFEEQPERQETTKQQNKMLTRSRKAMKKTKRKTLITEFENAEELSSMPEVNHKHIEAAYNKFTEKEFKEATHDLLDAGKVEKKDVAIALSDLAAKDKLDDEAIEELKKEFGITEEKEEKQ